MKRFLVILLFLLVFGLASCNNGPAAASIPPQVWKNMVVRIETHPSPPMAGISEIVVIITGPHGKPAGDLIVSLRGSETDAWVQAIEDGYIGVYRRAVDIGENKTGVVQVRIQQGAEQKLLSFPITLGTS
ncbi:MAG: hypothetical protein WBM09_05765 [Gallionella sp.]